MQHPTPPRARPRSASRPRSAGTTRTRSYFEKSSVNDDHEQVVTAPFLHSNDEVVPPRLQSNVEEDAPPISPLLGNFDDEDSVFQWSTTKPLKPQAVFVNDMQFQFSLAGIRDIYNILRGRKEASTETGILCEPSNHQQGDRSLESRGPIGYLFILVNFIASRLAACFSNTKRFLDRENSNDSEHDDSDQNNDNIESRLDSNESKQSEEDGLSTHSSESTHIAKSSNLLRLEERIRRELSLEKRTAEPKKSCKVSASNSNDGIDELLGDITVPDEKPISAKMDESYWVSPGEQLVGPKNHSGNIQQEVELTIQVKEVKFSHHPEFTADEKASSHVRVLYEQYRTQLETNSFHYLVTRLTEIFERVKCFQSERGEESKESSKTLPESMIAPLLNDLKSTSLKLVTESESIRRYALQIKEAWKELIALREKTGLTAMVHDVELKTVPLSNAKLITDVRRLVKEMTSSKRVLMSMTDIVQNLNHRDMPSISVTSIQFLKEVEDGLSDISHFSEVIELVQTSEEPEVDSIPKEEKLRRRKICSERYFARLLVNGNIVGDTQAEGLEWPSFSSSFDHRFICKMSQKPTDVSIQIWRANFGFVPDNLISTCFINVLGDDYLKVSDMKDDESNQVSPGSKILEWIQFSSNYNGLDSQHCLKGTMWLLSSCKTRTLKHSSPATHTAKIPQQLDLLSVMNQPKRLIRPPIADREHSKQAMIQTNKVQMQRSSQSKEASLAFKLPSGVLYSNKILLEEPLRHAMIKKRTKNPSSVPSPIPINEAELQNSDVYHDLLCENEETIDEIVKQGIINERSSVNKQCIMDVFRGVKEYAELRQTSRRKHHFSEVIQDVGLFRFQNDDEFELPLPPRKRSLFPKCVQRLPARQVQSCTLMLTVVGLKNIPTKLEANSMVTNIAEDSNLFDALPEFSLPTNVGEKEEETYLRLVFRGKTYHTSPLRKETVAMPLGDILQESSSINEVVDIYLFDSAIIDLKHLGGYYDDEETKFQELRYLGHVSLPISTILRKGTADGFVHFHSPDLVVGYAKDESISSGLLNGEHDVMETEHRPETNSTAMLRLHATTEPLTIIPPQPHPEFSSSEPEPVMSRIENWSQQNISGVSSEYHLLWPDLRGNSYLVSRFLNEQAPPPGFDTISSCAHFVSLIPSLGCLERLPPWWSGEQVLTSQQFLNIMAGGPKEHSVMLANFFLWLSKKRPADFAADIFLAFGFTISEGTTAWVMRRCKSSQKVVFWNAMTGCAYPQQDASCPLQKIHYLVSNDNVFRNTQGDKIKPALLDFNLANPRKWAPFHLDGGYSMPIMTVQDEKLQFTSPDIYHARQTQDELRESIQNAIRDWRRTATTFRSDVAAKIAHTIERLEQAKLQPHSQSISIAPPEISNRSVFGFTLHSGAESTDRLLERVKATEIHRNKNPRVEFAVAVRTFPYHAGVVSTWIFVCSLVPK